MSQQLAQRMYAVALSLVPDQAAAADLMFSSKSEADLRQRALAWRRAQGLPVDMSSEPQLMLTPDDEALALHLFRRGERRRRVRAVGVALLACLLIAGTVAGFKFTAWAAPKGLAADPVFAGEPLIWTPGTQDLQLLVYKAEAYPGAVTVWWEVLGPGADKAARGVSEGLRLRLADGVAPSESEITVHRPNRVLGRSLFPYLNAPREVDLVMADMNGRPVNWALELTLDRLPTDPAAVTYHPDTELDVLNSKLKIETVRVGKYATTVVIRYLQKPYTFSLAEITADGRHLGRQGTWLPSDRPEGEYEVVLEPVPAESKELRITFPMDHWEVKEYRWKLPDPELFREFRREGDTLFFTLKPSFEIPDGVLGYVLDSQNRRFPGNVWPGTDGDERVLRGQISLVYRGIKVTLTNPKTGQFQREPTEFRAEDLTELVLQASYPVPDPEVVIDLQGQP